MAVDLKVVLVLTLLLLRTEKSTKRLNANSSNKHCRSYKLHSNRTKMESSNILKIESIALQFNAHWT